MPNNLVSPSKKTVRQWGYDVSDDIEFRDLIGERIKEFTDLINEAREDWCDLDKFPTGGEALELLDDPGEWADAVAVGGRVKEEAEYMAILAAMAEAADKFANAARMCVAVRAGIVQKFEKNGRTYYMPPQAFDLMELAEERKNKGSKAIPLPAASPGGYV